MKKTIVFSLVLLFTFIGVTEYESYRCAKKHENELTFEQRVATIVASGHDLGDGGEIVIEKDDNRVLTDWTLYDEDGVFMAIGSTNVDLYYDHIKC